MILSRYCKIYTYGSDSDCVILFSNKNAAKLSIPASMLEDIRADNLSEEERLTLSELGFLVANEEEEQKEILDSLENLNKADRLSTLQLVMNLDCNLDCGYCFEGSRKGRHYLTAENANAFIEFVKANVTPAMEELRVFFYGGEPLLSADLIGLISGAIKSFTDERGIKYTGKLITNGTLLTKKMVTRLAPLGIKAARVTLDGPADVHDAARPFRGGGGSFRTILKNLKETTGLIELDLSGNFTRNNFKRFPEMFDQLHDNGLTPDRISSLQFYPVLQEVEGMVNCHFKEGCSSLNDPWIFEAEIYLREEILKRGFRTSKIIPVACMMYLRNRLIVNYDGGIYKCSGLLGRDEFKAGDIWKGLLDYSSSHHLENWKNDKCFACEYLPICFGGCRYIKFLRDGNMAGVDCQKPYLDATLETLVKQDIKYGLIGN